jgi:hypothetical protein
VARKTELKVRIERRELSEEEEENLADALADFLLWVHDHETAKASKPENAEALQQPAKSR